MGSETLVVHLLTPNPAVERAAGDRAAAQTRAGFVVGRAVGNSVLRHRVQRRLRHLCRDRLDRLPRGSELVVRALPPAGRATYQELGADLDRCLVRALAGRHEDGRHVEPGAVS